MTFSFPDTKFYREAADKLDQFVIDRPTIEQKFHRALMMKEAQPFLDFLNNLGFESPSPSIDIEHYEDPF